MTFSTIEGGPNGQGLENVFVKLFQVGPYDRYKWSELNPISRVKEPQLPIYKIYKAI